MRVSQSVFIKTHYDKRKQTNKQKQKQKTDIFCIQITFKTLYNLRYANIFIILKNDCFSCFTTKITFAYFLFQHIDKLRLTLKDFYQPKKKVIWNLLYLTLALGYIAYIAYACFYDLEVGMFFIFHLFAYMIYFFVYVASFDRYKHKSLVIPTNCVCTLQIILLNLTLI